MRADRDLPRLTPQNHRVTSPAAVEYNCVAWAAGDTENWWQPGVYWPVAAPWQEYGIGALAAVFNALGSEACEDDRPEPGFEKVALYGNNLYTLTRPGSYLEANGQVSSARRKTSSMTLRMSWRVASTASWWRS